MWRSGRGVTELRIVVMAATKLIAVGSQFI